MIGGLCVWVFVACCPLHTLTVEERLHAFLLPPPFMLLFLKSSANKQAFQHHCRWRTGADSQSCQSVCTVSHQETNRCPYKSTFLHYSGRAKSPQWLFTGGWLKFLIAEKRNSLWVCVCVTVMLIKRLQRATDKLHYLITFLQCHRVQTHP